MRPYHLYVVTDEVVSGGRSHTSIAEAAVSGGADVVQLRDKGMQGGMMLQVAESIRAATVGKDTLFIVNDRLDIALLSGADGVHLGQDDIPVSKARDITPPGFIIGVSAGNLEEALRAEEEGADYVGLGPIFPTGSKDDAGPACGLESLREVSEALSIPVVAIGGISFENAADVVKAGAKGLAVISAVLRSEDITSSCRELKGLITGQMPSE